MGEASNPAREARRAFFGCLEGQKVAERWETSNPAREARRGFFVCFEAPKVAANVGEISIPARGVHREMCVLGIQKWRETLGKQAIRRAQRAGKILGVLGTGLQILFSLPLEGGGCLREIAS